LQQSHPIAHRINFCGFIGLDLRKQESIRITCALDHAGRMMSATLQIRRRQNRFNRNFVIGAISNRRSDEIRALFHSLASITTNVMSKVFRSAAPHCLSMVRRSPE
jgi:hypothetical protein